MTETAQKKNSIFGFLKDAFVEEVPDAPKPKTTDSKPPMQASAAPPLPPTTGRGIEVDASALAKLETRLQQSLPPVYAGFMEQYETLRDVIPDEAVRFKAALKTSKAQAADIIGALDTLLSSMTTAKDEFARSFENNRTKLVGQLQQGIAATNDLILSKEAQLRALQEEIASLHAKKQTDAEHAQNEESRLERIRLGFEAAHEQVVSRLTAQKNRIESMPRG